MTEAQAWRKIASNIVAANGMCSCGCRMQGGLCDLIDALIDAFIDAATVDKMRKRLTAYLGDQLWAYPPALHEGESYHTTERAMAALWLACESEAGIAP